jgi:very-short-patch-repair endonuclease
MMEGVRPAVEGTKVGVQLVAGAAASLCMQQNSVPLIRRITLQNHGVAPLHDVTIRIWAEPACAQPVTHTVGLLGPNEARAIERVDLQLSPEFLVAHTESCRGLLHVSVECGGEQLARQAQAIDVLAYDHWSGSRAPVELLAAFVMPNHPVIENLLGKTSVLLRESGLPDALDGYQRQSRNAVSQMVAAIYEVMRREQFGYITPPVSIEESGQKIRTPERVLHSRLGTCLDLALLYAACVEQAGLHPLVVIIKGHAFLAVWLDERTLATASDDDPIDVRKRIDAGEMLAIECTMLTGGQSQSFDKAVLQGRKHLDDASKFHCVVDVARARKAMIRPLSGRISEGGGFEPIARSVAVNDQLGPLPVLPTVREAPRAIAEEAAPQDETRIDRWKRKLLDLTMHNRLLNFKAGAKTLTILCPDLARFEDRLAEGMSFQLCARPAEFSGGDVRDAETYRRVTGDDAVREVLGEELAAKRVRVDLDQTQLDRRALEIYREARLAQEESGTSALYCALGFLTWYQSDESDKPRSAPLLLLPVNLTRAGVDQGFKLEAGDDEPRVNVTLLEMLRVDFELSVLGLDPLPTDESGLDVPRIFEIFRSAVAGIKRWEVTEDVQVGFFSFTKFLMWRDLQEHTHDLLENNVVRHLVHHRTEAFDAGGPIPQPDALDRERRPHSTFCPVSADSSQLAAVFAAADGRSFVLEGPPGTGKSQTITNIIAQCMAMGRSVLFVAEKNVALNVVHERLEACGLGDHCLELHSNKAKKTDVMRQIERAMARAATVEPKHWSTVSERVEQLRGSLNGYVEALHRRRASGESAYRGLSYLIGHDDVPLVRVDLGVPAAMDEARVAKLRDLAHRIRTIGGPVGHVKDHPWRFVTRSQWDPLWQGRVSQALAAVLEDITRVLSAIEPVLRILGIALEARSRARFSALAEASRTLVDAPFIPPPMLLEADWITLQRRVTSMVEVGRRRDEARARARQVFADTVNQADLSGVLAELKRVASAWAPWRWFRRFLARRALRPLLLPGAVVPLTELEANVEQAVHLRREQAELDSLGTSVEAALGSFYQRGEGRWSDLEAALTWVAAARKAAASLSSDDPGMAVQLRQRWATMVSEAPELLGREGQHGRALLAFERAVSGLSANVAALETETGTLAGSLLETLTPNALSALADRLKEQLDALPRLRGWCQWKEVRDAAVESGLLPIVEAFESGIISASLVPSVFDKAYYQWWTEHTLHEEPALRDFHAGEHNRRIAAFEEADQAQEALSREAIRARLATRAPSGAGAVSKDSALGILRKETQKKKRHMPVRALLGETGDVVMRLTPCFLMSPISVAQYLDPRMPKFDLVIFDEASQIPAWEAIGAIARGRAAIIVGDPKQLPPTSFFGRAESTTEGDDSDLEDLESILDDCIGAGLPWLRLRWHYRSRHESLIAFSNHHYYDNNLLTLPSADTLAVTNRGVSFQFVGGVYDKGKSRTNRQEAEAVVADVVRRLSLPGANGSIGIVTLNTEQRTLIEDLLDAARRANPAIEPFFAEPRADRVFVKNLENVQGDERDVILFSIGYGPDAAGKVSMNFGPMNRDGGHRRLNVAITRARIEVRVFSSLRAEQIDLTRTQARGVKDLRAFLDYAERGVRALREDVSVAHGCDFDSPFEEAVCTKLRDLGWEVIPQVGCSGYRIDLGIVDPEARGRFLMGVECDGASYHSAASARDRDKLRASVLRGLGWKLYRIWSTDFWHDGATEIARLHEALQQEVEASRERRARRSTEDESGVVPIAQPAPVAPAPTTAGPLAAASTAPSTTSGSAHGRNPYTALALGRLGTPDTFYDEATSASIADVVRRTIVHEGPISLALLARRVGEAWAFGRVTAQVQERVKSQIGLDVTRESDGDQLFLWPPGMSAGSFADYRVNDGVLQRDANEIPLAEVRNAARQLLRQSGSIPADELTKEMARAFGFQRMGQRVAERMREGLKRLIREGHAEERGGRVVVVP